MLIYCHRTIVEAITAPLKQQKPIDWEKIYSLIPQFEMYPGWEDLLKWLKDNNIRFAVVSQSTRGILSRTFLPSLTTGTAYGLKWSTSVPESCATKVTSIL